MCSAFVVVSLGRLGASYFSLALSVNSGIELSPFWTPPVYFVLGIPQIDKLTEGDIRFHFKTLLNTSLNVNILRPF